MSVTVPGGVPARHPWLADFVQAPERAVADLLAGYARIPPYERADAPDAARMLFIGLPAGDPARLALGPAIMEWLRRRRQEAPPADRPRLQRWVREISEAFEIVALLEVADAAYELRRRYILWNEWTSRFVLSTARDTRAEYWRMLALTQPLVERPGPMFDTVSLAPLWLDICRNAGGTLPRHYLSIGLLGLRRLPQTTRAVEAPWIAGLAYWALARSPSDAEFMAEWRALKPLYPRSPGQWWNLVAGVLATKPFRDADIDAPGWWERDDDFRRLARQGARVPGDRQRSPGPEAGDAVINRLGEKWETVERLIDELVSLENRFVSATANPEFFVKTLHRLGTALIRPGGDQPHLRARKAQSLAREGLSWEPYDRFLWSLWREALEAEGAFEAAELVAWERIRRDPGDDTGRNQLAALLAGPLDRPVEAEALLRDTIAIFPDDPVARAQRAELLIATGRVAEAEIEVDKAFGALVADEALYSLRARLQSHRGDRSGAITTVQSGPRLLGAAPVLERFEQLLADGKPLPLLSAAQRRAASGASPARAPLDGSIPEDIRRHGSMRRLRERLESDDPARRDEALAEARKILVEDRGFAYARLLAARHGLPFDADPMPNVALAFEQALSAGDRARLEALSKQHPRLEALILVARALFGDEQAGWTLASLLNTDAPDDEPVSVAFLRGRLKPLLDRSTTGTPAAIIAANATMVRRFLHDSTDALLGDRIAA